MLTRHFCTLRPIRCASLSYFFRLLENLLLHGLRFVLHAPVVDFSGSRLCWLSSARLFDFLAVISRLLHFASLLCPLSFVCWKLCCCMACSLCCKPHLSIFRPPGFAGYAALGYFIFAVFWYANVAHVSHLGSSLDFFTAKFAHGY